MRFTHPTHVQLSLSPKIDCECSAFFEPFIWKSPTVVTFFVLNYPPLSVVFSVPQRVEISLGFLAGALWYVLIPRLHHIVSQSFIILRRWIFFGPFILLRSPSGTGGVTMSERGASCLWAREAHWYPPIGPAIIGNIGIFEELIPKMYNQFCCAHGKSNYRPGRVVIWRLPE